MRVKGQVDWNFIDRWAGKPMRQQPITKVFKKGLEEFSPRKVLRTRIDWVQSGLYLVGNFLPKFKTKLICKTRTIEL